MPKNALAPTSVNAFNMAPYEAQYSVKDTGFKDRKYAENVYSALLPALMRAHFGEYLAFSPATVTDKSVRNLDNSGEFAPWNRTIALNLSGPNAMLMEPYGKYGYVGMDGGTSTEQTLNALRTMLHEATHARMLPATGPKAVREHPSTQLYQKMSGDRFDEMIRDIRVSDLPSVANAALPGDVIDEYFATAVPARLMAEKNMVTRQTRGELKEIDRLSKKYPELHKMMNDWYRPELFVKD